jgi:hypothetical protein
MLFGTEEIAGRTHTFAPRQVHAAMTATDHVFFGLARAGRRLGAKAARITAHNEVNRREYHDDQQDLDQCHPFDGAATGRAGMLARADYPTAQGKPASSTRTSAKEKWSG